MKKNKFIALFAYLGKRIKGVAPQPAPTPSIPPSQRFGEVKEVGADENVSPIEPVINTLKFDIATLLQPKTFLYLVVGTVIFLVQTYNTLAIINLSRQNEKLREQILMTGSVITSQELRVHELHSIHNITQDALKMGLEPSGVPPIELWVDERK